MKRARETWWVVMLLVAGVLLLGTVSAWAATLEVGPGKIYTTIQSAINAASDGDTIWVANGTYAETLDIAKDITLEGESESGVTIDAHTFNDYGISVSGDHTVTLKGFTVKGPQPPTYGYGIKVSGENADISIHNVTVKDSGRSGIDLNGVDHGDLKDITVIDNGGTGLALTDSSNITVDNITTSGNAWSGMAIYTHGVYYTGGSDNITLTGANSFGEPTGLYTETENNYAITNLNIPVPDFAYTVSSNTHANVVGYYPDLTTASGAAMAGDPDNAFINDRSTGDFVVVPGLNIQSAVDAAQSGDTVHVLAGDYSEQVFIGKNMALVGSVGASIASPGSTNVTIPESAYEYDPIIFVYGGTMDASHAVSGTEVVSADVKDLDIDGQNSAPASPTRFVGILLRNVDGEILGNTIHDMFDADGEGDGPQTFGILVFGDSTVQILDNTISDFSRGGIGVSGDAGAAPDPVAHVEGNIVTGNGLETGTGWWAENGIQIGYGASGEIVGNTVTDCWVNNPSWTATGILVVDTNNVVVADNTVNNNQTGISVTDFPGALYGSPWDASAVSNVTVKGNSLDGNAWALDIANGVSNLMVLFNKFTNTIFDAIDVYDYGIWYPGYGIPAPSNVVIHYNSIEGSGGDGLWVSDSVLNPLDAALNWWGDANGPSGEGTGAGDSVSTNVIFSPWLGIDPDGNPTLPGVQITGPMLIIVAPVGPEPTGGYLNTAIAGANSPDLPYADTIEVCSGTYADNATITDPVTIKSQEGCPSTTFIDGNLVLGSAGIQLGSLRHGFTIRGNLSVGAGINAAQIHVNWNNIEGQVTNTAGIGSLDATYNFWGADGPLDNIAGQVHYYPYLPVEVCTVIQYMDDYGLNANQAIVMAKKVLKHVNPKDILAAFSLVNVCGMSMDDALAMVREYGRVKVQRALRLAHGDCAKLYTQLVGYGVGGGAGGGLLDKQIAGGGGAIEGVTLEASYTQGDTVHIAFTLTDPITGDVVTDAVATLSVVRVDPTELTFWGMIPYDSVSGQYKLDYDTSGLTPGYYDLYIGTSDGQTKQLRVEIVAP